MAQTIARPHSRVVTALDTRNRTSSKISQATYLKRLLARVRPSGLRARPPVKGDYGLEAARRVAARIAGVMHQAGEHRDKLDRLAYLVGNRRVTWLPLERLQHSVANVHGVGVARAKPNGRFFVRVHAFTAWFSKYLDECFGLHHNGRFPVHHLQRTTWSVGVDEGVPVEIFHAPLPSIAVRRPALRSGVPQPAEDKVGRPIRSGDRLVLPNGEGATLGFVGWKGQVAHLVTSTHGYNFEGETIQHLGPPVPLATSEDRPVGVGRGVNAWLSTTADVACAVFAPGNEDMRLTDELHGLGQLSGMVSLTQEEGVGHICEKYGGFGGISEGVVTAVDFAATMKLGDQEMPMKDLILVRQTGLAKAQRRGILAAGDSGAILVHRDWSSGNHSSKLPPARVCGLVAGGDAEDGSYLFATPIAAALETTGLAFRPASLDRG